MSYRLIEEFRKKGFHERIVCFILFMERRARLKLPWKFLRKIINQAIYHVEIHPDSFADCESIATLALPHPYVIVIHRKSVIGRGCRIFQSTTLGVIEKGDEAIGPPRIGDNVYIGAGCVILGDVSVGDNAKCGANSTILKDVPKSGVAVGLYK